MKQILVPDDLLARICRLLEVRSGQKVMPQEMQQVLEHLIRYDIQFKRFLLEQWGDVLPDRRYL